VLTPLLVVEREQYQLTWISNRAKSNIMTSRWPTALDQSLSTIDLYESHTERKHYDNRANLYAIIMATEHLERAYAQDCVTNAEYTTECNKLISQFKIAESALGKNESTESFMKNYQMDCPRAVNRLLIMGVPESLRSSDDGDRALTVATTVANFITAMDVLKLEQLDVDVLLPHLIDLRNSLVQISGTPKDWGPMQKVENWLVKLNFMRAHDRIDENDSRQLYLDLDSAYSEFNQYLKTKR